MTCCDLQGVKIASVDKKAGQVRIGFLAGDRLLSALGRCLLHEAALNKARTLVALSLALSASTSLCATEAILYRPVKGCAPASGAINLLYRTTFTRKALSRKALLLLGRSCSVSSASMQRAKTAKGVRQCISKLV